MSPHHLIGLWATCIIALWAPAAHAINVQEVTTSSGLTAWLVEDPSLPLVSVRIVFRDAGAASDTSALSGRAYLAGELLMEGAGTRNALAFQQEVESRAIRLSTSVDEDLFKISMATLSSEKTAAFALLGDMILRPRFESADVRRLQDQTRAQLRQLEASPEYALQRAWAKAAYGTHPYGNPTLGTVDTIARLDSKTLTDFTKRAFARNRLLIAVAGDISANELRGLLEKNLAPLHAQAKPDHHIPDTSLATQGKTIEVEKNIPQTLAAFGLNGVKRTDKDYFPAFVMNQVLGGGGSLNSRLGDEIREKRGLAYSVSSQLDTNLYSGILAGQFATRNERISEAVTQLKETIHEMRQNGAKEQEIEDAKRYLIGSFPLNLDSNDDVTSYLISMQLYVLGRDYLDKRNDLIRAVTLEQANHMAARLLDDKNMLVVLVGNPAEGKSK